MGTAQAAVAAGPGVAFRKDMQTPAANEFVHRKCDRFGFVAAAVGVARAGGEGDSLAVVVRDAVVGDRAAGQVTSQILYKVGRVR